MNQNEVAPKSRLWTACAAPEAISLFFIAEIEVPLDRYRFPRSVIGLLFPTFLSWKLD